MITKLITNAHDGDLPVGKGLCQLLADRDPEAQPERVQDHEEHAEPVDQVGQIGLRHIAPFPRAADPPGWQSILPLSRDRRGWMP